MAPASSTCPGEDRRVTDRRCGALQEHMFVLEPYSPPGWTPRHAALARYLQSHSALLSGPGLTATQIAARLRADPEWRRLCAAIGSPDAQLVREAVGAALPFWLGLDADLLAEGMRLACAGDLVTALLFGAVSVVVLVLVLLSREGA